MIHRLRRSATISIVEKLNSCQDSPCQKVLNSITCALDLSQNSGGITKGLYVCNGSSLFKIEINTDLCLCTEVFAFPETVYSIAGNENGIHWLNSSQQNLYTLTNNSGETVTQTLLSEVASSDQDAACNLFSNSLPPPSVTETTGSSILLNISSVQTSATSIPSACLAWDNVNTSQVHFSILYQNTNSVSCLSSPSCMESRIEDVQNPVLENLRPNTSYEIQIAVYRTLHNSTAVSISQQLLVNTTCGISSEPANVQCLPQSFNEVYIVWEPPVVLNTEEVRYQVAVQTGLHDIPTGTLQFTKFTQQTLLYQVSDH
uniref:Proto-oncogene tyrosine-protein kinase ROS n=1 Tax=Phallusia mammillata TaxID=59560 RepID=A0A6F9DQF4_9ASCI|nr:proto-oncogene tyrosine-protein kinase ROS [Phallusia mammillata]